MVTPLESGTLSLADSERATPPCPHFGPCGGCQLQHLTYPAQLNFKAAHLRALLEATGVSLPELQLHGSPPLAYRNRIRLTLSKVAGQLRAGYLRNPSTASCESLTVEDRSVLSTQGTAFATEAEGLAHLPHAASERPSFLTITQCPIAASILWRSAEAWMALINQASAQWLHDPHFTLDQLELLTNGDESALQFTLYLRTAAKALPAKLSAAFITLCETLRASVPELTGASIALLPTASPNRSRRNEQARPGPTWGAPGLTYSVVNPGPRTPNLAPGISYWLPRGAFFQANRFLLPELLALVCAGPLAAYRTGKLAFDLYAGVGLFSRALARSFDQVIAVEIAEPAASALASHKLSNLRAVKATTLDFLRVAVLDRERPDLIVLDPPRTGAGIEVCTLLGRLAAPTLIYVSCSPDTLPADLQTLSASGYRVTELHLVDLFPQTSHIETLAVLIR